MNLEDRIQIDLVAAMKAGDVARRDTLRLAKTALKNESVRLLRPLSDEETEKVIARLIKQRIQAAAEYKAAGSNEREQRELTEAELLKPYLPAQLSEAELSELVTAAITTTGAARPQDIGKVMGALKPQVGTRADGATLAALVRARLNR